VGERCWRAFLRAAEWYSTSTSRRLKPSRTCGRLRESLALQVFSRIYSSCQNRIYYACGYGTLHIRVLPKRKRAEIFVRFKGQPGAVGRQKTSIESLDDLPAAVGVFGRAGLTTRATGTLCSSVACRTSVSPSSCAPF
jgi:hypothetical protein